MIKNCTRLILTALLMMVAMAQAQTQHQRKAFSVQGCSGQAPLIQFNSRTFVNVQDLARITNSSLSSDGNQIIMSEPRCDSSEPAGHAATQLRFSDSFRRSAIVAMGSIREWGGMLLVAVQNGFPVGNAGVGNTIAEFQGRAGDNVALAATAASTDSDHRGLELLQSEFKGLQAWADNFVKARSSMSAANQTTSENVLKDDPEAQKLLQCGQFLAQMFAGGKFEENAACR